MNRRPWNPEDDATLRRLVAAKMSCAECAEALGRTLSAVFNRRKKIAACAFIRDRDHRREAVARVLALEPHLLDVEVGARLGCSGTTVARCRADLDIVRSSLEHGQRVAASRARTRAERTPIERATTCEREALAALADGPLSPLEFALRTGRTLGAAQQLLGRLRRDGFAFAEGNRGRGRRATSADGCGTKWYSLSWWLLHNDGLVYGLAHKIALRNRHVEADDLASVIRLAVTKCVKPFRARRVKFGTYAMKAARYDAIAYCLAERRRGVYVPKYCQFDLSVAPPVGSLDAMAEASETAVDGLGALADRPGAGSPPMDPVFWQKVTARLPARLARLLLAHYRDGKSFVEIGREEGCTKQNIEHLVRKAEDRIRRSRTLDEYAPEEDRCSSM